MHPGTSLLCPVLLALGFLSGSLAAQPEVNPSDLSPSGREIVLFKLQSDLGVRNHPSQRTVFPISTSFRVTKIWTYHWNNGHGKPAGTITLKSAEGTTYGPWPVGTIQTSDGSPVYWIAKPGETLPRGTYEVLDSDPASWSTNDEMGNRGCAWVIGEPAAPEIPPEAVFSPAQMSEAVQSFRLQAIPDPVAALTKFSSSSALRELSGIEASLFSETPPDVGWRVFFASALYSIAALPDQTARVLFYHPWSDTGLLLLWKADNQVFKLDQARLVLGDSLRQYGTPPFALQPQWEREAYRLTPLLSSQLSVGETLAAFDRLCSTTNNPAKDPVSAALRSAFEQSLGSSEVQNAVNAAAALRFEKGITALVRYEEDPALEPCRESTALLLSGLRNGDLSPVQATLPQTSSETLDLIKANAVRLARFQVAAILKTPTDSFVFLSHPVDPNNVLILWFQIKGGQFGLRQVNFFNHTFSASCAVSLRELVTKGLEP